MTPTELAIVIPVFNEAETLESVIRSSIEILDKTTGCVIAIDDGSTDQSLSVLRRFAAYDSRVQIINKENEGHGPSIRIGYEEALRSKARYIFQVDSDLQLKMSDFWHLWNHRHRSVLVSGIRRPRRDGWNRKLISKILAQVLKLLFSSKIEDANSPFRLMKCSFLSQALPKIPVQAFAPNIFLSVLAAHHAERLCEIVVQHSARPAGKSHLMSSRLVWACGGCVVDLLKFKVQNFHRGMDFQ